MKESKIRTRKDLFVSLQAAIDKAYRDLLEGQRLGEERRLLKTYLIEVDVNQIGSIERTSLEEIFNPNGKDRVKVYLKDEEGFFEVIRNNLRLFVDTTQDPRFWRLFTLSYAVKVDGWLDKIVKEKPWVDKVWFSDTFLEHMQAKGEPRGFGLDFDFRKFVAHDDEVVYLKMQIWGGGQELYKVLKDHLEDKVVLSKIRVKIRSNEEHFVLEDVKYDGKFSVRGTDIYTHLDSLNQTAQCYRQVIEALERGILMRWERTDRGSVLKGGAIHFQPKGGALPISPKDFAAKALNGSLPFRLLGFVDPIGKDGFKAEVLDLHSGGTFYMEMYPDIISLYVAEGTCANTILRFYTNLQQQLGNRFVVSWDKTEVNDEILWRVFRKPG